MSYRTCLLGVVCALGVIAAIPAGAATLTYSGTTITGASGVDVGGVIYDVTFQGGSCSSVFDGCDNAVADFDFTSEALAESAANALWALFGPDYRLITTAPGGCQIGNAYCFITIPSIMWNSGLQFRGPIVALWKETYAPQVSDIVDNVGFTRDYVSFAVFTPTPVPLPAALPLLAAGISAMGFMGWRKRRKAIAI